MISSGILVRVLLKEKQWKKLIWDTQPTSVIFVHKTLHWALYHMWFQNKVELYFSLK